MQIKDSPVLEVLTSIFNCYSGHFRRRPGVDRNRYIPCTAAHRTRASLATTNRQIYLRKLAIFFAATSAINVVIGTQGTYRSAQYMDTVQFCGQSCHVMKPEFTAHQNSPHVECMDCTPEGSGAYKEENSMSHQAVDDVDHDGPKIREGDETYTQTRVVFRRT